MAGSFEAFDASLQYYIYRSPHGLLTIQATSSHITRIAFGEERMSGPCKPNELTNRAATQLLEYFAGRRTSFNLPIAPAGTAFQKQVWEHIQAIPYGESKSIAQIAEEMGCADSYRVVGTAAKKNPLAIVIPTHRICAAPGRKLNATKANVFNAALLKEEQRRKAEFKNARINRIPPSAVAHRFQR